MKTGARIAAVLLALVWAPAAFADALPAQRPGKTDLYVLSFGLWGSESVFESEARRGAAILVRRLGARGRILRANTRIRADATVASMTAAARAVRRTIDPTEDVVAIFLTSHGAPEGIGLASRRERRVLDVGAVRALLDETGARYRVLIVSACYSGIFTRLVDADTLVITAARADRPSFGCRDGATWTYFGRAFFAEGVARAGSLDEAYRLARRAVLHREKSEGFDPSEPQMAGGRATLARLAAMARP